MLLFIDNIFRFTQAGSEVSALLGRMPSAVGYQPTLLTEMGELQERITSTQEGIDYVCAGRFTCPPTTTRPGAGHDVRPSRCHDEPVAAHRRSSVSIPAVDPLSLDGGAIACREVAFVDVERLSHGHRAIAGGILAATRSRALSCACQNVQT